MSRNKTAVSNARSYTQIGEYWDEHDLDEAWDDTQPAEIEVDIESQKHYYPLERHLSERVNQLAKEQGLSPETLINLWVQEKVNRKD